MKARMGLFAAWFLLWTGMPVEGGNHSWRVNEVFSNEDGTIQFVELKECCGFPDEIYLLGAWVLSETTGNQFYFPELLPPGSTSNKHLLLATEGFAELPGAPTPDYLIVDNFLDLDQDTINFIYIDTLTFGFGELPTDGLHSIQGDGSIAVNSPTNFLDETGSIDVSDPTSFVRGDCNGDGVLDIADAIRNLEYLFTKGEADCLDAMDTNDDGSLNIADAVYSLNYQFGEGPMPGDPFGDCGFDPTLDTLNCYAYTGCP